VVAEGIETEYALNYVGAHGCTQAQGFYLGEPMSGESFESWYWAHSAQSLGDGAAVRAH
jgi:EAL domain-containing protein (putative c-di-GMP-specific phosphodiesterase class I)